MSSTTSQSEAMSHYVDLALNGYLNLQPGQRLLVMVWGDTVATMPFVREVAARAYQSGANYVDVEWKDEQIDLIRLQHSPAAGLDEYPAWRAKGYAEAARRGDAFLFVAAETPGLLSGQDPERMDRTHKTAVKHSRVFNKARKLNNSNWLVAAVPTPSWAAALFPDVPPETREARLWAAMAAAMRLDQPDPLAACRANLARLVALRERLTARAYDALHFTGPGTDLRIGLVPGHIWRGGREYTESGLDFTPNMPTEEVFTMPHYARTEGVVRASKPLNLMGTIIEDFSLTFRKGRVVDIQAGRGAEYLERLLATDKGAGRLGEVALVPHSSAVSQAGVLFHNTLLDENAACHIALGQALRSSVTDGVKMNDKELRKVGGNKSGVHVDFMIGSDKIDVDGIDAAGRREPLLRQGEWVS